MMEKGPTICGWPICEGTNRGKPLDEDIIFLFMGKIRGSIFRRDYSCVFHTAALPPIKRTDSAIISVTYTRFPA